MNIRCSCGAFSCAAAKNRMSEFTLKFCKPYSFMLVSSYPPGFVIIMAINITTHHVIDTLSPMNAIFNGAGRGQLIKLPTAVNWV